MIFQLLHVPLAVMSLVSVTLAASAMLAAAAETVMSLTAVTELEAAESKTLVGLNVIVAMVASAYEERVWAAAAMAATRALMCLLRQRSR